jgi:hypothetical protein
MARNSQPTAFGRMVGVGTLLAFVLSWFQHHSLMWAAVHAVYSWFYIAYYALSKSGAMPPIDVSPTISIAAVALAALVGVAATVSFCFRRRF